MKELSSRETEIMEWVAMGKNNGEIGEILGVSIYTVKGHLSHIFQKLGASNRVQAVRLLRERKEETNKC